MSQNTSFRRKVIYISAIALLLIPLSLLSQPSTKSTGNEKPSAGGVLAQLRTRHGLSQAGLGEIDPASESMKLATLGLKPIAVVILWDRANNYKKTENWDRFRATLNQIRILQPNFINVWEFQAHNLSYNISVEFDNYRHRYQWVKKGIDFLILGTRYNQSEPRLFWNVGWNLCLKLGRSDERVQYRRLFREDDEYHQEMAKYFTPSQMDQAREDFSKRHDNWLLGRLWYLKAYELVETRGASMRGKIPLIYYGDAPMALIAAAEANEAENDPGEGEIAERMWKRAEQHWREYGARQLRTTRGVYLTLNGRHAAREEVIRLRERLDELVPGVREQLRQERIGELSSDVVDLMRKPVSELTDQEKEIADFVDEKMRIDAFRIADQADSSVRRQATRLARQITDVEIRLLQIEKYRTTVNYLYWENRCAAESTKEALRARKHIYDATRLDALGQLERSRAIDPQTGKPIPVLENGQPLVNDDGSPVYQYEDGALEKYEKAWEQWAQVFDKYPVLLTESMGGDLADPIKQYVVVLQQLGMEERLAKFKLMPLLEACYGRFDLPTVESIEDRFGPLSEEKNDSQETTASSNDAADGDPSDEGASRKDASQDLENPASTDEEPSTPKSDKATGTRES